MLVIFTESGQPVIALTTIYCILQRSLFNKMDFKVKIVCLFICFTNHYPPTFSIPAPSLSFSTLILQLCPGPPARLSLQLVYLHRGLNYAPLSEPPRRENERDVSPQNPGNVLGSTAGVKTEGRAPSRQTHCTQ